LELQPLVKQAALFLNVTAKEMASLHVGNHFEVSIEFFKNLKRSIVDVYTKSNEQFDILFQATSDFKKAQIDQLISQGIANLYIKSADRLKFVSDVTAALVTLVPMNDVSADDLVKVQEITINHLQ